MKKYIFFLIAVLCVSLSFGQIRISQVKGDRNSDPNLKVQLKAKSSITGAETLTNKTFTSPKINENVVMDRTSTQLNRVDVTSSIQTLLDSKISEVDTVTGPDIVVMKATMPTTIGIACSDETTALTASTSVAKFNFRMPYAVTVTAVKANVTTAPTDATILVDIHESGTTILSTKIMIDATELTSTTATTPYVIADAALADDASITVFVDQIGSTVAGAGLKIWIIGTRIAP